jgi:hypothetical protein
MTKQTRLDFAGHEHGASEARTFFWRQFVQAWILLDRPLAGSYDRGTATSFVSESYLHAVSMVEFLSNWRFLCLSDEVQIDELSGRREQLRDDML